jgi:hypothetical protein
MAILLGLLDPDDVKALRSFKALGTMHPTTQCHTAQDLQYIQAVSSAHSLRSQQTLYMALRRTFTSGMLTVT